MTLVRNIDHGANPATHAVIIGIGAYPWLLGGAKDADPVLAEGMGQLQSPPRSALAVAEWLLAEHADPTAPLATVDLLIMQADGPAFYEPAGEAPVEIEAATKDAVAASLRAWKQRGNLHGDSVLLFFFCGHGVGRAFDLALLCSDFGSDDEQPFRHAIWFEGLKEGMKSCKATRQVYFVDACRVASGALLRDYTAGLDPVIGLKVPFTVGLRQSIYYATTTGEPAYGRPGTTSMFTGNLLQGLSGMASNDNRGEWWVETTGLQRVLTVLADEFAPPEYRGIQSPTSGEQVSFEFHRLAAPPRVPLYLSTAWHAEDDDPPPEVRSVAVDREGERVMDWPRPWEPADGCAWEGGRFRSNQTAGMRYNWSVVFEDGSEVSTPVRTLNPPFRIVEVTRDGVA